MRGQCGIAAVAMATLSTGGRSCSGPTVMPNAAAPCSSLETPRGHEQLPSPISAFERLKRKRSAGTQTPTVEVKDHAAGRTLHLVEVSTAVDGRPGERQVMPADPEVLPVCSMSQQPGCIMDRRTQRNSARGRSDTSSTRTLCPNCGSRRRRTCAEARPEITTDKVADIHARLGYGHPRARLLLRTRGGGGRESWFSCGGGKRQRDKEPYQEFPDDFDYDVDLLDDDAPWWAEVDDDSEASRELSSASSETGTAEEEDESRGPLATGLRRMRGIPGREEVMRGTHRRDRPPEEASGVLRKVPELALDAGTVAARHRSLAGAVISALAGALGVKLWSGFMQRRGDQESNESSSSDGSGTQPSGGPEDGAGGTVLEGDVMDNEAKLQALEEQLAFLEEDRRRMAAAAKEARASRRRDDRQLKEYVHTLEAHLEQLSTRKEESEASIVESVKIETAKALERAHEDHQAAAAAAAQEREHLRADLAATRALVESAVQDKEAAVMEREAAEQQRSASDALLRTEQGRSAALENEVERLRESSAALTQRLMEAAAKAERACKEQRHAIAARDSAEEAAQEAAAAAATEATKVREEEASRFRQEVDSALAAEKDKLRAQMEARLATMRAGLRRRLQEARAERAAERDGDRGVVSTEDQTATQ